MKKAAVVWKRASRIFVIVFIVMFVVALWGIVTVARSLASVPAGTADFSFLGLQMFVGTKEGSVSILQPKIGVVLVIVLPVLAALLTAAVSLPSLRRAGSDRQAAPDKS